MSHTKPRSQPTEVISARVPATLRERLAGFAAGMQVSPSEAAELLIGLGFDAFSSELQAGQSCRLVHTDGDVEYRVRVALDDYEWRTRMERLLVAHAVDREFAAQPAEKEPS
jgi:hypothetical protein